MQRPLASFLQRCSSCLSNSWRVRNRAVVQTLSLRNCSEDRKNRTNPDVAPSAIHNVQSIRSKWTEYFKFVEIPEPESSAELIVAHVLGLKTLHGIAPWQILSRKKTDRINELCALRLKRVPVQYIIEEWDFHDLVLQMRPPVLIPRPETEGLITLMGEYLDSEKLPAPDKVLEIGCGSGAIILALASEYPKARCVGVDRSPHACELTLDNADSNELEVEVVNVELNDQTVRDADVFSNNRYDLVVSNPPYLSTAQLTTLAPEIYQYEDVLGALDGGRNGLDVIETILKNAQFILNTNGLLWLEVDSKHPELVKGLTKDNPRWNLSYIKTFKDFLGKPRFCLLSLLTT